MQRSRENRLFLPGFAFPAIPCSSPPTSREAARDADMLMLVTPSQKMRENVRLLAPYLGQETLCVSCSKGIEIGSLKRMTQVIVDEIPSTAHRVAALERPQHLV